MMSVKELHHRLEPGLAVQLSSRLEKYNPMFLEDPIRSDNFDEMARVAGRRLILLIVWVKRS